MKITERYATAIRSSNLSHTDERHKPETTSYDDVDVLGAMGLADRELTTGRTWDGKPVPKAELAVALERLFMGDKGAAAAIVAVLTERLRGKAPALHLKMTLVQSQDMARACLAWHRDHVCKPCGGHGQFVIQGSTTLGGAICKACKGSGQIPFAKLFRHEHRELAHWLLSEMEREQGRAGPAAMRKMAASLNL